MVTFVAFSHTFHYVSKKRLRLVTFQKVTFSRFASVPCPVLVLFTWFGIGHWKKTTNPYHRVVTGFFDTSPYIYMVWFSTDHEGWFLRRIHNYTNRRGVPKSVTRGTSHKQHKNVQRKRLAQEIPTGIEYRASHKLETLGLKAKSIMITAKT